MANVSLPPTPAASPKGVLVAMAHGAVTVRRLPGRSAKILATLARQTAHGYPTLMLVRGARRVDGETWYSVWFAKRPRGGSGWVRAASVRVYTTVAKIVVDVSARRLSVYQGKRLLMRYTVAVGSASYPTPTGTFFITEKIKPLASNTAYGVLAMALSVYQPKLPSLGSIAIHGTDNAGYIGKAVSDGCIRMRNSDVLKVSAWVPSGSPVVIRP